MLQTLGYHLVKSAYGQWLPGDERGYWSETWDRRIGFFEPHTLHSGDPVRFRIAEERMKFEPVRFSEPMIQVIIDTLTECIAHSGGGFSIVEAAIEPTHMHLLIPYTGRDIDKTAKWIADQTTKNIHHCTPHSTPVWSKGRWCSYIFDERYWNQVVAYIENHNLRQGRSPRPYPFLK